MLLFSCTKLKIWENILSPDWFWILDQDIQFWILPTLHINWPSRFPHDKKVLLVKVDTLKNVVDALMKSSSIEKFSWCRETMGVVGMYQWLRSSVTLCVEKKKTSGRMLGVCYIIPTTSRTCRGVRAGDSPPLFVALGVVGGLQGGCSPPYRGVSGGGSPPIEGFQGGLHRVGGSASRKMLWTLY